MHTLHTRLSAPLVLLEKVAICYSWLISVGWRMSWVRIAVADEGRSAFVTPLITTDASSGWLFCADGECPVHWIKIPRFLKPHKKTINLRKTPQSAIPMLSMQPPNRGIFWGAMQFICIFSLRTPRLLRRDGTPWLSVKRMVNNFVVQQLISI